MYPNENITFTCTLQGVECPVLSHKWVATTRSWMGRTLCLGRGPGRSHSRLVVLFLSHVWLCCENTTPKWQGLNGLVSLRIAEVFTSVEDPWSVNTGWSLLLTAVCREYSEQQTITGAAGDQLGCFLFFPVQRVIMWFWESTIVSTTVSRSRSRTLLGYGTTLLSFNEWNWFQNK